MFLHAFTTQFAHPITGETLALSAPLPPECSEFLRALTSNSHAKSTV
jgi:23S rRNA pseudouridine955/2504/2580 synthase